jgi:immune inhibitor A
VVKLTGWGIGARGFARLGLTGIVLLALLVPWVALNPASAQDGKRGDSLSWDDAPVVPPHRSEADWLVDVGWKTAAEVYGPFPTHEYQVGEAEQFIPLGGDGAKTETYFMRYRTPHAYFWFERGVQTDPARLEATARFFEDHIWPLNHRIYGDEWNPGIDGDSRIHIINQAYMEPGILGVFNPEDQCPRSLCPESNQREIIYINLYGASLGSPEYLSTLAHEHQHLIQYHVDGNEQRWFNEGLSQLAEHLNGFQPRYIGGYNVIDFLKQPDHQLNGWTLDGFDLGSYYGAAYLFMVYLYERFGLDFIRALAASDYDGLASVQRALEQTGQGQSIDGVFGDWILANFLDDPYVSDGRYYYQTLDLPNPIQPLPVALSQGNARYADTVNQYGADYLSLIKPGTYQLTFGGSDRVAVIGAKPHSKSWMWWSYNGTSSASRLTGQFDLRGLKTATLAFSAWWSMEEDYDWFQVLVSDDGGKDWKIVGGPQAKPKSDKTPGAYYSGHSNAWINERIDLSDYAGKTVLIRFEYLTDSSRTLSGVALDDLGIVELENLDDVESATSAWTPEGFLRIPATVPQHWSVVVVEQAPGQPATVQPVTLDAQATGRATITVPDGGSATLVIGAMAPFTTTPASYKIAVQRVP